MHTSSVQYFFPSFITRQSDKMWQVDNIATPEIKYTDKRLLTEYFVPGVGRRRRPDLLLVRSWLGRPHHDVLLQPIQQRRQVVRYRSVDPSTGTVCSDGIVVPSEKRFIPFEKKLVIIS